MLFGCLTYIIIENLFCSIVITEMIDYTLLYGAGLGFPCYSEKFTKVDNENRVKVAEVVEGGFLDIGFTLYRVIFEIKENPNDDTGSSCTVKLTLEYKVKEEVVDANPALVTKAPLIGIMSVAKEHLLKSG